MGKNKKRKKAADKAAKKAEKAAKKAVKAAKKAVKAAKKADMGRALAIELGTGGSKKDWQKVAKLLAVKCCTPDKRKCKKCVLTGALAAG